MAAGGVLRAPGVVWGGPEWKVFLDHPDDIRRTIGYIEAHPDKLRQTRQRWQFVTTYDGWPLHEGHSLNSPYARRCGRSGGIRDGMEEDGEAASGWDGQAASGGAEGER